MFLCGNKIILQLRVDQHNVMSVEFKKLQSKKTLLNK